MRCTLLLLACLSLAADWPQFRGPAGDGVAPPGPLVSKWGEKENVRWKVAIHDKGWSSPVVLGKQVWLTTATEDGRKLYALCLDRDTGAMVHDVQLFTVEKPLDIKQFNSHATPTPVLEAGRAYVHFGSTGTACLDAATGKPVWTRRDLPSSQQRGAASSPILWRDLLILHLDGFDLPYAVALDKNTGETRWRHERKLPFPADPDLRKSFATPAIIPVGGKDQLVSSAAVGTVALDPATGEELWRVIHGGMNEASRPFTAHGLTYLTAGHTQALLALKPPAPGERGDRTATAIEWRFPKGAPTKSSPVVVGDLLFYMNDSGLAACLDARTGKVRWQERLGENCSASPVAADGKVYFVGEKSRVFVVKAAETFELLQTNTLAEGCMASPAVAADALFLRTKSHLYCLAEAKK